MTIRGSAAKAGVAVSLGGPARVALLYAALAAAWILLSDSTLTLLPLSAQQMAWASIVKGISFVVVTSLVLYRLMVGMVRDVAAAHAEVAATMHDKNEQLAQSNADLEQFAYVASHDLREPLRMVSAYIALLERRYGQQLDGEAHEFLFFAREGAQRLDRMVLDLLEFSRVGRRREAVAPVPLAEVVEAARHDLLATIAETGAVLSVPPDMPVVMGARSDLERLFQNLLANALKYRHPQRHPEVTIAAEVADGECRLSVSDNGIGIEPQYFDRIFCIFQRLHTREEYDGNGIGLAVCRRIVLQHGGRIWVESVPGRGSTFLFTLPAL